MSAPIVRAMIVDGRKRADDGLRFLLASHDRVDLVAEAQTLAGAVSAAKTLDPHVAFVEWRVGDELGVSLVDRLREVGLRTRVVLATAYDGGGLQAFEAGVLDYLTLPIPLGRLERALSRVLAAAQRLSSCSRIAVRRRGQYFVVDLDDVLYFEAHDRFVHAHGTDKRWELDLSLSHLERRLPAGCFFRCHRCVLVRLASIERIVSVSRGRYEIVLASPGAPTVPLARQRMRALLGSLSTQPTPR